MPRGMPTDAGEQRPWQRPVLFFASALGILLLVVVLVSVFSFLVYNAAHVMVRREAVKMLGVPLPEKFHAQTYENKSVPGGTITRLSLTLDDRDYPGTLDIYRFEGADLYRHVKDGDDVLEEQEDFLPGKQMEECLPSMREGDTVPAVSLQVDDPALKTFTLLKRSGLKDSLARLEAGHRKWAVTYCKELQNIAGRMQAGGSARLGQ